MRSYPTTRSARTALALALCAGLIWPGAAAAATAKKTHPTVTTTAASHVVGSSAELEGTVNPHGTATSYYFQYGPTRAYGLQTKTVSAGSGEAKVKVGQLVTGLSPAFEYHFRIVGVYGSTTIYGKDLAIVPKASKPKVEIEKLKSVPYGTAFLVTGTLRGETNGLHQVELQSMPYPYRATFSPVTGVPVPVAVTPVGGHFSIRVNGIASSTQFRVITLDPHPLVSSTITVLATVRVNLHVRTTSKAKGLVRFYGTVIPAVKHGFVSFQVQKLGRPTPRNEEGYRWVSQFTTILKRATSTTLRFSLVATIKKAGRYRAYVTLPAGTVASGGSEQTYVLKAAPSKAKRKLKKA